MMLFFAALETVEKPSEKKYVRSIYDRYVQHVKGIIVNKYPELSDEADDLVQLVFVDVIKYRKYFLSASDNKTKYLLLLITKHKCVDALRKLRREKNFFDGYDAQNLGKLFQNDDRSCLTTVEDGEIIVRIKEIINSFSDQQKDVLVLKYFCEMKHREIAEITGLSETNVGTIIQRGTEKIRKILREEGYIDE